MHYNISLYISLYKIYPRREALCRHHNRLLNFKYLLRILILVSGCAFYLL